LTAYGARIGRPIRNQRSLRAFWLLAGGVALIAVGIALTLQSQRVRELNPAVIEHIEPEHVDPVTNIPIVGEAAPPPLIELPQEEAPQLLPVPPLDESDAELTGWLNELFDSETVARFLIPEAIVRNVVVTIDNLPRAQVILEQRPVAPTPGSFIAAGSDGELFIAAENFARYAPFVGLIERTDAATIVGFYRRFRPLFQEAYEELGFPGRSFDGRLLEVVDHLLGTPDVAGPIALVQPRVMYQYADPALEAQSAGRKWLMRMGPQNAAVMKAKLREIRAELETNR
jgi:hypothetical protein